MIPEVKEKRKVNKLYTTAFHKILHLFKSFQIIQGGQGAGKTWAILFKLIGFATSKYGTTISIVSDTLPNLRKGAMRDFKKIMKLTGYWDRGHWHGTHRKFTFPNGSFVEFFSLDKKDSARGPRRDVTYVNEINRISMREATDLRGRTHKLFICDFNPVNRFFIHDWKDKTNCDFISVTFKDNEQLPENEIETILEKKEWAKTSEYWYNWWQIYGLGKLGTLVEGTLYGSSFSFNNHTENTTIGNGRLFLNFDFNVNPMTCTLAESDYMKARIHAELKVKNSDVYDFCQHINQTFGPLLDRIFITGDPSGHARSSYSRGARTAYQIIQKELDLPKSVILAPKSHLSHINYRLLLNLAFQRLDIKINPECKNLIYDLQHVTIDEKGKPIKHRRDNSAEMDFLDGMLYFLQTEFYDELL